MKELNSNEVKAVYLSKNDYEKTLIREVRSLREELKATHSAYGAQKNIIDKENLKNLSELKEHINIVNNNKINELKDYINNLLNERIDLEKEKEEWIGRTLKYQFLYKKMKDIGLKQSDDIFECFEDIDVPDVSISLKEQFIPTAQTDNTDFDDTSIIDTSIIDTSIIDLSIIDTSIIDLSIIDEPVFIELSDSE